MKSKVIVKMLASVFSAVLLVASLVGIVFFAYLLHFLSGDNLGNMSEKVSVGIQNATLACFSTPKIDSGLSNDEQFGAVKTPITSNVLLGALGEDQKVSFDELEPNTASVNLHTSENGGSLVTGSTSDSASTVFRGVFKTDNLPFAAIGARFSSTPDGDLRGLTANGCSTPALDFWFIGGSTHVQSTTSVLVANANSTPAQIELTVWGAKRGANSKVAKLEDGSLRYGAGKTVGVNAHSQIAINLASGVQDEDVVAIHLKSNFSPVAATVYTHEMDKLTPKGLDFLAANTVTDRVYLPGVEVHKDSHFSSNIQLLAPEIHEGKKTVTINCSKANASGVLKTKTVDLVASEIQTIDTDFLDDGIWNIEVVSSNNDKSILLGTSKVTRISDDNSQEYAYIPSAVPSHGLFGVVKIPNSGFNPQIVIATVDNGDGGNNANSAYTMTFFNSAGALIGSVQVQLGRTPSSFSVDSLAQMLSDSLGNANSKEELKNSISFVSLQPVDSKTDTQKVVGNIIYNEEVGLTAHGFSSLEKKSLVYNFTTKMLLK
ncbi:MAG: DUF5719 family protein [Candidatus Ancillula sp.]|jgi:hypothetical protein|nr:DUF5719 family protein [Candidatus Ancillula sp.]